MLSSVGCSSIGTRSLACAHASTTSVAALVHEGMSPVAGRSGVLSTESENPWVGGSLPRQRIRRLSGGRCRRAWLASAGGIPVGGSTQTCDDVVEGAAQTVRGSGWCSARAARRRETVARRGAA